MKPFNLEEAKAGKPFGRTLYPNYEYRFIGTRSNGDLVYEFRMRGTDERWTVGYSENVLWFHMIPEKKVFKGLLCESKQGVKFVWNDTLHERAQIKVYNFKILKEFEVEYEEK